MNIVDKFVWDITANVFYNIAGYSLPGCDLQYMWSISTQHNVIIKQVSLVVTLFQLRTPGNSIPLVMRLLTLTFECFFFVFAVQWYHWQSSKLFSELEFEDFLCLHFRVTRRFMLRMQHELNTTLSKYEQNKHFIQKAPCFRWSFYCFGMLQVHANEISLRNSSGGPEYLRTL